MRLAAAVPPEWRPHYISGVYGKDVDRWRLVANFARNPGRKAAKRSCTTMEDLDALQAPMRHYADANCQERAICISGI